MAFNSRASKKGAKAPEKEQRKQARQQAQKREPKAEQPPQMEPALAAIVAADATLAGFVARWERTFLEVLRMNDIDRALAKKNGTASDLFRQHRKDDLADLDYVMNYIKEKYGYRQLPVVEADPTAKAGGWSVNRTVCALWCRWILTVCKYRRRMEQLG